MLTSISYGPALEAEFKFAAVNRKTPRVEAMFRSSRSATDYAKGKAYIKLLAIDTEEGARELASYALPEGL